MFGLVSRFFRKNRQAPIVRRPRLFVEQLETRDCPTGLSLTFDAQVLAGHLVQLSGMATGDNAAGATVNFSGAASGMATTDSSGAFSITTDQASLGTVYAYAVDQEMEMSDMVSDEIAVSAPVLSFSVVSVTSDSATFSASIAGLDIAGQFIYVSGVASAYPSTDSTGAVTFTASVSTSGTVDAYATDLWGQMSNMVQVSVDLVMPTAPELTLATQVQAGHAVVLTGTLTADDPNGRTVSFFGAVSGTATTDSSGNFTYTTTDASLGTVYVSWDTATASHEIVVSAPVLSFSVVSVTSDSATFSASIAGLDVAGQSIFVNGVASAFRSTDSTGAATFTASVSSSGTVDAYIIDLWGQMSNMVQVSVDLVMPTAPELTLATQVQAGHTVVLTGTLTADDPNGRTVSFFGAVSGTATTDSSGNFTLTTTDASLGTVYVSWDTATASDEIAVSAPVLSFAVDSVTTDSATFSASITGLDIAGQSIWVYGAASANPTTNSTGAVTFTASVSTSGTAEAYVTDLWGQMSNMVQVSVNLATAPEITLDAEVQAGHTVVLSGTVTADSPGGLTVTFSGTVTGTTTTDSSGNFTYTTTSASLGTVYASWSTATASDTIAVDAPVMYLSIVSVTTNTVTLFAGVDGLDYSGRSITIGGAITATKTANADGYVIFTASLSASGTVEATTTDLWGQVSNTAQVSVTLVDYITPTVSLSVQVLSAHTVVLTGTVTDNDPAGVVVTFSGAVTGSTTTDADGNYIYTTQAASLGTVYATRVDAEEEITTTASATIAVTAPSLSLQINTLTHDTVTISGTLSGLDPLGRTITLGGVAAGTVITDSTGAFILTTTLSGTGTITASATDLWAQASNTAQATVSSLPTTSTQQICFSAPVASNGNAILSGYVLGGDVEGVTVNFSGSATGSTTTDSAGYFTYEASLSMLGIVYATGTNSQEESTNTAMVTLAVALPLLTFGISSISGSTVTFTGHYTGVNAGGQTITIGGDDSGTVVTDGSGNFTFTKDRSTVGTLTVAALDAWGQTSNTAAVNMPERPPVIRDFVAVHEFRRIYLLTGRVVGENVVGLTVDLGGVPGLEDGQATVQANGTFYIVCSLTAGGSATAWARVTDQWGRSAGLALTAIPF